MEQVAVPQSVNFLEPAPLEDARLVGLSRRKTRQGGRDYSRAWRLVQLGNGRRRSELRSANRL